MGASTRPTSIWPSTLCASVRSRALPLLRRSNVAMRSNRTPDQVCSQSLIACSLSDHGTHWWERETRNRDILLLQQARNANKTHVSLRQDARLAASLDDGVHVQHALDSLFQVKKRCVFMHGSGQRPNEVRPVTNTFPAYWGKVEGTRLSERCYSIC